MAQNFSLKINYDSIRHDTKIHIHTIYNRSFNATAQSSCKLVKKLTFSIALRESNSVSLYRQGPNEASLKQTVKHLVFFTNSRDDRGKANRSENSF